METNFTKGEWKVSNIGHNNGVGHVVADIEDYEHEICALYRGVEENIANAKLIAAAPDMYETLIKVKEWLIDMNLPIIDNIEKAIKKATE